MPAASRLTFVGDWALREYRLKATELFAQDLEDSAAYYLEQVGEAGASRFLDEYDKFCNLVVAFPGYGSLVGDTGLRWRKIGVFAAVYSEDAEEREIVLLRLYYPSSTWRRKALDFSGEQGQ